MTVDELVEKTARALHEALAGDDPDELIHHPAQKSWETPTWRRWEQWDEAARSAILAVLEGIREPSAAMRAAAVRPVCEFDSNVYVGPDPDGRLEGSAEYVGAQTYTAMVDALRASVEKEDA